MNAYFEDWEHATEPDDAQHPHGLNGYGDICPECDGEGGDTEEEGFYACFFCNGCGYYPACEVHARGEA